MHIYKLDLLDPSAARYEVVRETEHYWYVNPPDGTTGMRLSKSDCWVGSLDKIVNLIREQRRRLDEVMAELNPQA